GVYDFNEDGIPEISFGPYIFSSLDGTLLAEAPGATGTNPNYSPIGLVVAANLLSENDCGSPICQGLELAAGPDVYAVTLVSYTNPALNSITLVRQLPGFGDGYTSIADFDADGKLDIIVGGTNLNSNTSGVYVWDPLTEQLSKPFWTLGNATFTIGRPSVADFDNDGELEIAVHTEDFGGGDLQVIDQDMSTLWSFNTNDVSGATGCTDGHFNGDGAAEVVYRDQTQLRIIEGSTGTTITNFPCTSGTINEYPVIADLNGDGQTEITCNCGGTPGNVNIARTTVWGSDDLPWMPARPVWNQHAYFNVNVLDDLSIPQEQQQPHLPGDQALNGFLTQYSNPEYPVPDATAEILGISCTEGGLLFSMQFCNVGDQVLSFNTPFTIWEGDPTN
ncbi:MAG: VCBS repeat-containing protein, partial [Phaeodactylibacter sp.]|nr:VCBS repeat-containing protein [Phaeodactylibacter sp.]